MSDTGVAGEGQSVQQWGFLFTMPLDCSTFEHASANVTDFLGIDSDELWTMTPRELLGSEVTHAIRNALARIDAQSWRQNAGTVTLSTGVFDILTHQSGDHAVVELTPTSAVDGIPNEVLAKVRWFRSQIDDTSYDALLQSSADALRAISGYSFVALLREWPDRSLRVIAESNSGHIASSLGARFPAGIFGDEEQNMFSLTPVRITRDCYETPVPLLSSGASSVPSLDLAVLRSPDPRIVDVRRAVGAQASVRLPIIVAGNIWGMAFLAHHKPRLPEPGMEHGLELAISGVVSSRTRVVLERQRAASHVAAAPVSKSLLLARAAMRPAAIRPVLAEIAELIPSNGVAYLAGGQLVTHGLCPDPTVFDQVRAELTTVSEGVAASHEFSSDFEDDRLNGVAGALSIAGSRLDSYELLVFRQSSDGPGHRINEPNQLLDDHGARHSVEWTLADFEAAEVLRNASLADLEVNLVVQELNHRVRNILSLAQSVISQSRPSGQSNPAAAFDAAEERILALASAHNQATEGKSRLFVRQVLEREAAPHGPERITLTGNDDVALDVDAAPIFTLVLHELFSNAAKYGSLSLEAGALSVVWELSPEGLFVRWTETGGPPANQPSDVGFGLELIADAFPYELGGETTISWDPDGLKITLFVPSAHVSVSLVQEDGRAEEIRPVVGRKDLAGALSGTVLIVEDDFLIALQSSDVATQLGAERVIRANSNTAAMDAVDAEPIHFALVDINLGDELSTSTAQRLSDLGIPFVFLSGYDTGPVTTRGFRHIPFVRKPVSADQLHAVVWGLQDRAEHEDGISVER